MTDEYFIEEFKKLDLHLEGFTARQKELSAIKDQLTDLADIVKSKLLPAYEREMDRKKAYQILAEDRDALGNWGRFFLVVGAVITAIIGITRIWTKI